MKHLSNKKSLLSKAVLASTLFTAFPVTSLAFTNLDNPTGNNSNSGVFAPGTGYNYIDNTVYFTILDATVVGTTLGTSFENDMGDVFCGGGGCKGVIAHFAGNATVDGDIGVENALTSVNLTGGNLKNVAFDGDIFKADLLFTTDPLTLAVAQPNVLATFSQNVTISGVVDNLTGFANRGRLLFTDPLPSMITGVVGGTSPINDIYIGPGSNLSLQNTLHSLTLTMDTNSFLLVNDNADLDTTVFIFPGSTGGVIQLQADTKITGNIGSGANALEELRINAVISSTTELQGATNVINNITAPTLGTTHTLIFNSATGTTLSAASGGQTSITTSDPSVDIIKFNSSSSSNIFADIGTLAFPFLRVEAGLNGNTTVNGDIFADTVKFTGPNSLIMTDNSDINGNVEGTAGSGILTFLGTSTVTGDIGTVDALNDVNIRGATGKNVTFNGDIFKADLNFDSTLGLAGTGVSATFTDAVTISGDVDNLTATPNTGVVIFQNAGPSMVVGTIGATSPISNVVLDPNVIVQFQDQVATQSLTLDDDSLALMNDLVVIDGTVVIDPGALNTTMQFQAGGGVTGNIGSGADALEDLIVNAGGFAGKTVSLLGSTDVINNVTFGAGGPGTLLLNAPGGTTFSAASLGQTSITTPNVGIDNIDIQSGSPTKIFADIGTLANPFNLVKVAQNGDATFNGDIFANAVQFNGDNTFALTNNSEINGDVTTTSASKGILQFLGNSVVTGDIGAGNPLKQIALSNSPGVPTLVDFQGSIINADGMVFYVPLTTAAPITAKFSNDVTIDMPITTLLPNNGILEFAGTGNSLANGIIGTAIAPLNALNITGAGGTLTLAQDLFIGTGNVNFAGAADAVTTLFLENDVDVNGQINNLAGAGKGIVTFLGNGSVTGIIGATNPINEVNVSGGPGTVVPILADMNTQDVFVTSGGTFTLTTGTHNVSGNVTLNPGTGSIINIPSGDPMLIMGGSYSMFGGTVLAIDLFNTTKAPQEHIIALTSANIPGGSVNVINPQPITGPGEIVYHLVYSPDASAAQTTFVLPVTGVTSTLLQRYETRVTNVSGEHRLDLVVTSFLPSFFFEGAVGSCHPNNIAKTFDSFVITPPTAGGTLGAIFSELLVLQTAEQLVTGLSTLAPIADSATVAESFLNMELAFGSVEERLDQVHFGLVSPVAFNQSGYAAGDLDHPRGTWIKGLGRSTKQEARQCSDGYSDRTWGLAIGQDVMLSENALIGANFSVTTSRLNHDISDSRTRVHSYIGGLYGSYYFNNPFFVKWAGALGYNSYDGDRNVTFGSLYLNPESKYHAWQFGAKGEVGYIAGKGNVHLVPMASLYYSHLNFNSYTETGLDTANQFVDGQNYDQFLGGLGAKLINDLPLSQDKDHSVLQTDLHAFAYHDFANDRVEVNSQFIGGGPAFVTQGFEPVSNRWNVGASITSFSQNGLVLTASYDFFWKQQYDAHTGFLKIRWEW